MAEWSGMEWIHKLSGDLQKLNGWMGGWFELSGGLQKLNKYSL